MRFAPSARGRDPRGTTGTRRRRRAAVARGRLFDLLLRPADHGYEDARRIHNGLIDKRPAHIARCRGTADVIDALRFARESGLEISVRGGGHNVAGRAVTDGGVMIDLSLMKGIHVDPKARTACAEGGVSWRELKRWRGDRYDGRSVRDQPIADDQRGHGALPRSGDAGRRVGHGDAPPRTGLQHAHRVGLDGSGVHRRQHRLDPRDLRRSEAALRAAAIRELPRRRRGRERNPGRARAELLPAGPGEASIRSGHPVPLDQNIEPAES